MKFKVVTSFNSIAEPNHRIGMAIKDESHYIWYEYTGSDSVLLRTKNGKREENIVAGSKFGVRTSSNGRDIRLITEKLGPTIVFTIDPSVYMKLVNSSKES
jgi:hypothetical protein